jgi:hypothetical protein
MSPKSVLATYLLDVSNHRARAMKSAHGTGFLPSRMYLSLISRSSSAAAPPLAAFSLNLNAPWPGETPPVKAPQGQGAGCQLRHSVRRRLSHGRQTVDPIHRNLARRRLVKLAHGRFADDKPAWLQSSVGVGALDRPDGGYVVCNPDRLRDLRAVHEPDRHIAAGVLPENVTLAVAIEVAGADD